MFQEWDIRNEEQIAECVRHSDIVYNLVGRDYETKYVYPFFFFIIFNATATIADFYILPLPSKGISPLTMYTSTALGVSLKSPRALGFLGWSTFLTSTPRQPRRPSSIVPRQPARR